MEDQAILVIKGTDKTISITRESGVFSSSDKVIFDMAKKVGNGKNLIHKEITTFSQDFKSTTLTILSSDIETLDGGSYVYNMILEDSNGRRKTMIPPSPFVIGESVPTND